jgi:outer membrane protein assembly factor BamD
MAALRDYISKYPAGAYIADAKYRLSFLILGEERQKKGKKGKPRFRNVIEKFDTTSHTPEALYRLTESSLALGVPDEAVKYAAVLGANYPGNKWYDKAFKMVNKNAAGVNPI